jgi:hypothetical protein
MGELNRTETATTSGDFNAVERLLDAHVTCVAAARDQTPERLDYATESAGRQLFAALARIEQINLLAVARTLRCAPDVASIARASLCRAARAFGRLPSDERALLVAALVARPEELGLWLAGELAVLIGRWERPMSARLSEAALRDGIVKFAEAFSVGARGAGANRRKS